MSDFEGDELSDLVLEFLLAKGLANERTTYRVQWSVGWRDGGNVLKFEMKAQKVERALRIVRDDER